PGAAAESDLRRFAEEVAPAVRDAVAKARGVTVSAEVDDQLDLPPAERTTGKEPDLDESTRPRLAPRGERTDGPGSASAQMLVDVHNHLRSELEQLRGVVAEVATGHTSPAVARSLINRMSMRQNYWSLGAFCATYCRVLTIHHAIEDSRMFVALRSRDEQLG